MVQRNWRSSFSLRGFLSPSHHEPSLATLFLTESYWGSHQSLQSLYCWGHWFTKQFNKHLLNSHCRRRISRYTRQNACLVGKEDARKWCIQRQPTGAAVFSPSCTCWVLFGGSYTSCDGSWSVYVFMCGHLLVSKMLSTPSCVNKVMLQQS